MAQIVSSPYVARMENTAAKAEQPVTQHHATVRQATKCLNLSRRFRLDVLTALFVLMGNQNAPQETHVVYCRLENMDVVHFRT